MSITKAFIPIGGMGTRLYPLTVETSKAMIRFMNKFLIDFIMISLASQGIEELYLGVSGYFNYKALHDHLGGGFKVRLAPKASRLVRIRYQPNEDSLGNAHSVKILAEYYKIREPVLVVQGDTVTGINVRKFYRRHREAGAFMSIALKEIASAEELRRFGVAALDENMMIKGFVEKPKRPEEAPSKLVNTGVYILSKDMIDFLLSEDFEEMIKEGKADFGAHVIPRIISEGRRVAGYIMEGFWFDIGTPESYLEASLYLLRNLEPEKLEVSMSYKGVKFQGSSPSSKALQVDIIERAATKRLILEGDILIGRHVRIEDEVKIANSIIDNYTIIGGGSRIEDSVIMDRSYVASGAHIENSVVGRHVKIMSGSKIIGSYIGDDVVVEENVELVGCKVWPHRRVKKGLKCSYENIL